MPTNEHTMKMDSIYRYQKYIYDLTRKFFLFGRDQLIQKIDAEPGSNILEMGCGTGRNLILLNKKYSGKVSLFGIDASGEMLQIAGRKMKRHKLPIQLKQSLAEDVHYQKTFGLDFGFDVIFFSYSLSMIPSWREAMENAINNLKVGGAIYIVDFYDQSTCPRWFRRLLKTWLSLFHVEHKPELLSYIRQNVHFEQPVDFNAMLGNYAFVTKLVRRS